MRIRNVQSIKKMDIEREQLFMLNDEEKQKKQDQMMCCDLGMTVDSWRRSDMIVAYTRAYMEGRIDDIKRMIPYLRLEKIPVSVAIYEICEANDLDMAKFIVGLCNVDDLKDVDWKYVFSITRKKKYKDLKVYLKSVCVCNK